MKPIRFVALSAAAMFVSPTLAQTSTFNTDAQGWQAAGIDNTTYVKFPLDPAPQAAPWQLVGGNPGGSLRIPDLYFDTYAMAPAAYLGDRSSSLGLSVSFDLFLRFGDNIPYDAFAIAGRCGTLFYVADQPQLNQWYHFVVPLRTGTGWHYNAANGDVPTDNQFQGILADVRGLFVRTEWNTGDDDTNLDNFIFPGTARPAACPADLDDGSGLGHRDGGVTLDDLLYFLDQYAQGLPTVDLDNGGGFGSCDGGITLDDLLFFLSHFADGC